MISRALRMGRVHSPALLVGAMALLAALAVQARHHHARTGHFGESGQFDYYVLSLSWAPTYCLTHGGGDDECQGKGYGFVLHGLWPQYEAGGYPERCATGSGLSEGALARGRTLYPSERLMQHEWREHGTCSGLDARAYFETADRATAAIRIPAQFEAPRAQQRLTAGEIMGLFRSVNPHLPPQAMAVTCSRAELAEVRVCLRRDLSPRACGRGVHSSCPRIPLAIPASR